MWVKHCYRIYTTNAFRIPDMKVSRTVHKLFGVRDNDGLFFPIIIGVCERAQPCFHSFPLTPWTVNVNTIDLLFHASKEYAILNPENIVEVGDWDRITTGRSVWWALWCQEVEYSWRKEISTKTEQPKIQDSFTYRARTRFVARSEMDYISERTSLECICRFNR